MTTRDDHNEAMLRVRVTPGASRSEIVGFTEGILHVKIAAPPVKGRANRELIEVLSRATGVSRGSVEIVRGLTSRSKVVAIRGISLEEALERLLPRA